jgi:uncharacterized protein YggE
METDVSSFRTRMLAGLAAVLIIGLGAALVLELTGRAHPVAIVTASGTTPPNTITVSGTGTVTGIPDILTVQFQVDAQGDHAQAALDQAGIQTKAVIGSLARNGVAAKDISTNGVSLQQTMNGQPLYDESSGYIGSTIYNASETITAVIRNVGTGGTVLDDATAAAGDSTRIDSATFGFSDQSTMTVGARPAAIAQAHTKAQSYSAASGSSLGSVSSINETDSPTDVFQNVSNGLGGSSTTQVSPGQQAIHVTVTVVYNLN